MTRTTTQFYTLPVIFILSFDGVIYNLASTSNLIPNSKKGLHSRNRHRDRYDFDKLGTSVPELRKFISNNKFGDDTIDFSNSDAVKALNKALLKTFYRVNYWDIPPNYLCPPVPGRADYVHYIADLLSDNLDHRIPMGCQVHGLDIGVGANAIYPLIANAEYGWRMSGTDVNNLAINSANNIITKNNLSACINVRLQPNTNKIFENVVLDSDKFDFTICNPPFHASEADRVESSSRKWRGLHKSNLSDKKNFEGQSVELCFPGGEKAFIQNMITESADRSMRNKVMWFTTLVSKGENLPVIYQMLRGQVRASEQLCIEFEYGNKRSRVVAWTFLDAVARRNWTGRWTTA